MDSKTKSQDYKSIQTDATPPDVQRWVNLIHEHLTSEELSVSWLLKQPGVSKKTAERFRMFSGQTTKSYITGLRMELARRSMKENKADAMTVAVYVGYRSRSTFVKAYKRYFGKPPGDEDENQRGGVKIRAKIHTWVFN